MYPLIRNILQVNALTRTDLHSEYTCSVTNNNISNPITNTIHLDMNCKYLYCSHIWLHTCLYNTWEYIVLLYIGMIHLVI